MSFGKLLKSVRVTRGLRLKDIADAMDVSIAYISDLERGNRRALGIETVKVLAGLFDLTSNEVIALARASIRERGVAELAVAKDDPRHDRMVEVAASLALSWPPTGRVEFRL